jgi:phosphoglucosamine mutase
VSGHFLSAAVEAGLASSGVDVLDAGTLPTPAAAYLIGDIDADFGVMISASHNPAPDNGIKIFARGGVKLPDEVERRIEEAMAGRSCVPPAATSVGWCASRMPRTATRSTCSRPCRTASTGCTSCSTARTARHPASPRDLPQRGAKVTVIGADPDGININDGYGSTHLELLRRSCAPAPTSASPTTATPTGAWRWMPRDA